MKQSMLILLLLPCISGGTPNADVELENEVREFVQEAAYGEGVINPYNVDESLRKLASPQDWEAVLAPMLDLGKSNETEITVIISIIGYRKSSGDPRIQTALNGLMNQYYAAAANSAVGLNGAGDQSTQSNRFSDPKQSFCGFGTDVARLKEPESLLKLLEYATSSREDDLLAFTDPTYANILIAAKAVGEKRHASLIEELLPKLRRRGMKEKTIELGEEALRAIEGVKRPDRTRLVTRDGNRTNKTYSGSEKTELGAVHGPEERRPGIATLAAGALAVMILLLLGRTWWKRSRRLPQR